MYKLEYPIEVLIKKDLQAFITNSSDLKHGLKMMKRMIIFWINYDNRKT
jgi:hypothetical protein